MDASHIQIGRTLIFKMTATSLAFHSNPISSNSHTMNHTELRKNITTVHIKHVHLAAMLLPCFTFTPASEGMKFPRAVVKQSSSNDSI